MVTDLRGEEEHHAQEHEHGGQRQGHGQPVAQPLGVGVHDNDGGDRAGPDEHGEGQGVEGDVVGSGAVGLLPLLPLGALVGGGALAGEHT